MTALGAAGLLAVWADLVPSWAHVPAQAVVSVVLAGWCVALAFLLERQRVLRGKRFGTLAAHAGGAALTATLGTALVYASVRIGEPETVERFLRGPVRWVVVFWVVLYGLLAALMQNLRTRERLREQELAATRAELQALRAQLEPHFLFNTLHSLGALVRGDRDLAEDALERFAELMRYLLRANRSGEDVALAEELRFVRNYLALEKLRLGERLHVVDAVDDDVLACHVPALILQPLVENAIRHGIAMRPQGGTVRVTARREPRRLLLAVEDDGQGSEPDDVARSEGLALRALTRQLAARFGDAHRVEVRTRPGHGFEVHISLPVALAPPEVPADAASFGGPGGAS